MCTGGCDPGAWGHLFEPAVELIELIGEGEAVGHLWGLGSIICDLFEAFPDGEGIPFRQLVLQSLRIAMFRLLHRFGEPVLGLPKQVIVPAVPGCLFFPPQSLELG